MSIPYTNIASKKTNNEIQKLVPGQALEGSGWSEFARPPGGAEN